MDDPFQKGVDAFWEKLDPTDDNPYEDGTDDARKWENGYYAAYRTEYQCD